MKKIPKCQSRSFMPQGNNIKVTQKETNKESLAQKITQKNLKFSSNRQFGKDITKNKENIHTIYNNHCTKIITIAERKANNNVYIKKHSSASQVAQNSDKAKIIINNKPLNILKQNKSGCMINRKKENASEYYYNKKNNLKNDYGPYQGGSKLHNSISFGMNYCIRPSSSINNCLSVRLTNLNNNNRIHTNVNNRVNNRSINFPRNNNYSNIENNYYNNKNEISQSNLDLM